MNTQRILIAEEATFLPVVASALKGYKLLKAVTLQQASQLVSESGVDLIVIGSHFDDSRATELIKLVRIDLRYQKTPIVVLRLSPFIHEFVLTNTLDVMQDLHIIDDYLELEGDPTAERKIRHAIEQVLATRSS